MERAGGSSPELAGVFMSRLRSFTLFSLCLLLAACDGPPPAVDAGWDAGPPDSGPPDSGPPLACAETTRVDGVLGDTVTVRFDTRMTETRPRDLGLACGNVEGELRWAPQEVVELHVPGTGSVAVELDTVFDGDTDLDFNTVLQVRESCERVPPGFFPPTCFDDVSEGEFRSRGAFVAEGGRTYYVIVTGYSYPPAEQGTVDEGRVRLDVTVRENSPPTITDAALVLALDDTRIFASGNDPDADVRGVAMNFYDASGLLDIYGDGEATEDGDVYVVFFAPAPTTADYAGEAVVPATVANVAAYLRAVDATHATYRVFDSAWAMSAPLRVDIEEATLVGFGEACDGTHVCRPEMTCASGTCAVQGPPAVACSGAIDLGAAADGVPVTRTGTTGAGYGVFAPSTACVADPNGGIGAETIYTVTVPAGVTADLILTTDLPETGSTDTILYVRSTCGDSGTELGCNDDRARSDVQSDVTLMDLTEGTYYVFVERYGGLASGTIGHALRATLRPVLGSGEPCDDTGATNRCASGACSAGTCP